jgi:protease-4
MRPKTIALAVLAVSVWISACGCGPSGYLIQPVPIDKTLSETEISRDKGLFIHDKIAVIEVDGMIANTRPGLFGGGDNPVSLFVEKLDRARRDEDVKAVVLRLNSPGGTVAASESMYHALVKFRRETGKPVVACMLDIAASGAYYLACGCDGIIAQPSTVTGSIGTIMQTVSFEGTMAKLGIRAEAIKSGELKDIASPLRNLSDEERIVLQGIINEFYEQFLTVVDEGRPQLGGRQVRELADGRIFTGVRAVDAGLADKLGYPGDAVAWAKRKADIEKARVVMYHRPIGYKPNIYASSEAAAAATGMLVNIQLPDWLTASGAQFLYLWQPGTAMQP